MVAAADPTAGPPAAFGRVLIIDGWERMALAVCRALGRVGCFVGVAGTDPRRDIVSSSRYVHRYDMLPDPWGPAAPYERALRELIEQVGYAAVVAVHDSTLARLASIDLPVPTFSRLDEAWHVLQDKRELGKLCERAGLGYPQTEAVESPDDVDAVLGRVGLPVFVKASVSARALPERIAFDRGATFARTREEAVVAATELWDEMLPVIVQTPIDRGVKLNAVVLRRDGRSEVRYAHRVLREHPREGGTGISLESLDPNSGDGAATVEALEALCEQAGYEGICQAEVYRSASDGGIVVVDVNPRLWGSTWFTERQGLRVVERCLRQALDLPALPPATPRPGMRFHVTTAEIRWLQREPDRWAGLRDLVRTTRPGDVFEWIDASDPKPTLRYFARTFRGLPTIPSPPPAATGPSEDSETPADAGGE